MDASGNAITDPSITNPNNCAPGEYQTNPAFLPGLLPFDLTRGGQLFDFHGRAAVRETALYAQDTITLHQWTLNVGLRCDFYNGLSYAVQTELRVGVAYTIKPTNTLLRFSYGRFLGTPYNENLVLSSVASAAGLRALFHTCLLPLPAGWLGWVFAKMWSSISTSIEWSSQIPGPLHLFLLPFNSSDVTPGHAHRLADM